MKIVHLEDSVQDHLLVCRALKALPNRWEIQRVETIADLLGVAMTGSVNLVLADYRLPGFTALDAWSELQKLPVHLPFVLVSGTIGESAAVSAIHLGISDYVHKDNLDTLARAVIRSLDVHQIRLDKEFANQELVLSEKRLAEFATHLQAAIEQERASIAREIHDDIGGSLAAAKLDLAWIGRHFTDSSAHSHIQAATEMLQHALGASQRIMMNLRPAILDQGLFAAVNWLGSSFEKRTGIKTQLRTNNEQLNPSKAIQLAAYRTVQEALTNASKHAECDLVNIELSDAENFLTVEITDNGIGLAKEMMAKTHSFGIRGLKERARTVGGWLDVSSTEGNGTSIILSIPLEPSNAGGIAT